ncbi:MAG: cytochrome c [Salinarimonas sp.]|nr:cytochrome c [Salinarimonas sp.]
MTIAAALLLAGCLAQEEVPFAGGMPQTPSPERGQAVAEQWCATCHARDEEARAARVAQEGDGPSFAAIAGRDGRDEQFLWDFLEGDHFPMPTYRLFPQERADIAAYIVSLRVEE